MFQFLVPAWCRSSLRSMVLALGVALLTALPVRGQDVRDLAEAQKGDASAQYRVGLAYLSTLRTSEARPWFKLAAEQGHVDAMYAYGDALSGKDYEQGTAWIRRAAERGHLKAQLALAARLRDQQPLEAKAWYEKLAAKGNAEAEYWLGSMYVFANGVPRDHTKAFEWYLKAANHGHDSAMFMVALALERGEGTAADPDRAFEFLLQAAAAGNTSAMDRLKESIDKGQRPNEHGRIYAVLGTAAEKRSRWTALSLYKKGAATGSAECQWHAGRLLKDDPDPTAAIGYWKSAAAQGHAEAQGELRRRGVKW